MHAALGIRARDVFHEGNQVNLGAPIGAARQHRPECTSSAAVSAFSSMLSTSEFLGARGYSAQMRFRSQVMQTAIDGKVAARHDAKRRSHCILNGEMLWGSSLHEHGLEQQARSTTPSVPSDRQLS